MRLKPGIYYGRVNYEGRRSLRELLQKAYQLEQEARERRILEEKLYSIRHPYPRF